MTITPQATPSDAFLAEEAENPELVRAKIVSETARINWLELQKFYAAGAVITVEPELDLIDVAFAFSRDQKEEVAKWLQQQHIGKTTAAQAQIWFDNQTELWAVVISPWVLVQYKPLKTELN